MKRYISEIIKEVVSGLVLDETPALPEHRKKTRVKEPTKSISIKKDTDGEDEESEVKIPRSIRPDEVSKDIRKAKRPTMKPPRREENYKKKWTGLGSRETRKEYQKEYRKEHGNGYFKKSNRHVDDRVKAINNELIKNGGCFKFDIINHEAYRIL